MFWLLFLFVAWAAAVLTCVRLCAVAFASAQVPDPATGGCAGGGHGLNLYEAAFLAGGPYRVGDLTLVSMHRQRRLLLAHTGWVTVVDPEGRDELERSVISAIGPAGQSQVTPVRASFATAEPVRALADRLVAAGLAMPVATRTGMTSAVRQVQGACLLVLLTGAAALLMLPQDTQRGPVAAWFALPLILTTGALAIAYVEVPPYTRWASPAGARLLGRIAVPRRRAAAGSRSGEGDAEAHAMLTALAIHGAGALGDPRLRAALRRPARGLSAARPSP